MDRFFGLDRAALDEEGLVLLATLYDDVLVGMYESMLKEENIPYLKKDRGAGGAVRLIMGSTLYGTDLYVPEAYWETAKALITPANGAENDENKEEDSV